MLSNTTYYVKAYADNSAGRGYGNEISFTTLDLTYGQVTDVDGNVYKTIQIGEQVWMAENLRVTHYRNGEVIPNVDDLGWSNVQGQATGAYCNYDNDANATYGKLYNWYAVNDNRNIAPEGWHISSDAEWQILIDYLERVDTWSGRRLKEPSAGDLYANNQSGFTARLGGYRGYYGFSGIGETGIWWTSNKCEDCAEDDGYVYGLSYNSPTTDRGEFGLEYFCSVRCVKD